MDKSKYTEHKKEIGRNMCGEPIYEIIYIPKFINCNNCKKELRNMHIDYIDNGVYKGHGVICIYCGWRN